MSVLEVKTVDGITVATIEFDRVALDSQISEVCRELRGLLADDESSKVILNFSNVRTMASMMIGELLVLQRKFEEKGGCLRLCALRPEAIESMQITGIRELFKIDENEETGLAELKS